MLNRVFPLRVPPVVVPGASDVHVVRDATMKDLRFILHLMKREHESLGFIPREGVERRIERREVSIALENGDVAGFCLFGKSYSHASFIRPIFQACIDFDVRRRRLGLDLVGAVERSALLDGQCLVRLWCRASLPANEFWKSAGYVLAGQREGGAKRKIPCNLWVKQLRPTCATDVVLALQPARGTAGVYATRDQILEVRPVNH